MEQLVAHFTAVIVIHLLCVRIHVGYL